jgi:hypothetical protein
MMNYKYAFPSRDNWLVFANHLPESFARREYLVRIACAQTEAEGRHWVEGEVSFDTNQGFLSVVPTTECHRNRIFFARRRGHLMLSRFVRGVEVPETNIISLLLKRGEGPMPFYKLMGVWFGPAPEPEPLNAHGRAYDFPRSVRFWGTYSEGHAFPDQTEMYVENTRSYVCPWIEQ